MNTWLDNLTVAGRLALAFGFLLLVLTVQSILGYSAAHQSVVLGKVEVRHALAHTRAAAQAQDALLTETAAWQAVLAQPDVALRPPLGERIQQASRVLDDTLAALATQPANSDEAATLASIAALAAPATAARAALLGEALAGTLTTAALDERLVRPQQALSAALSAHRNAQSAALQGHVDHLAELANGAEIAIFISAIVSCATATLLGWLLNRSISRPLRHVVAVADRVARGDLTARIDSTSRNEMGDMLRALNRMAEKFRATIETMRTSSGTIMSASSEIAASNLDLSTRTELQASSVEIAVSSVQQMSQGVAQNAEAAKSASAMAHETATLAARGGQQVASIVETMQDISSSSQRMAQIVSVIDGIAFQTNILALNAAVEAARAGDQGRGFAVVASEVRTLAQRSADAAREIKTLIQTNLENVQNGVSKVGGTGDAIRVVVESSQKVSAVVASITASTLDQSRSIEQINQAIRQLDQGVHQNAALVEESAAAAESLKSQTVAMNEAMQQFQVAA